MSIVDFETHKAAVEEWRGTSTLDRVFETIFEFFVKFSIMRQVARERAQLKTLPDSVLKDIGIARIDANQEANLPFWNVPEGRQF